MKVRKYRASQLDPRANLLTDRVILLGGFFLPSILLFIPENHIFA